MKRVWAELMKVRKEDKKTRLKAILFGASEEEN